MEIKKILRPGFRYEKCKNKECNRRFETTKVYEKEHDCVCSNGVRGGKCAFKAKEQYNNTLGRFRE